LKKIETYVKENKHLPEVPSEKQNRVLKDQVSQIDNLKAEIVAIKEM
jgi:hypothetical protein